MHAAVPFDKGVLIMKKLSYPAEYAVLSQDEMTYTEGGSVQDAANVAVAAAAIVGTVVLASSYMWGIGQARTWLNTDGNKEGNVFTILGRATDAIGADMTKSASNFVRDAVSTTMVIALAPLSAILLFAR